MGAEVADDELALEGVAPDVPPEPVTYKTVAKRARREQGRKRR
jgi:hypothetical protein